MEYSSLKFDLEMMELKHKQEKELLEMKQFQEREALVKTCTHTWDDGTDAKRFSGNQRDFEYVCKICQRVVR